MRAIPLKAPDPLTEVLKPGIGDTEQGESTMTISTLSTKTVRYGMQAVALLAVVCGAARAGEWPIPFPLCPSAPLTYIPLWNIPSNTGILCFVGNPPTAPGPPIFDGAVVPVIVKLLDVNGKVKFFLNPTKPLYVPV